MGYLMKTTAAVPVRDGGKFLVWGVGVVVGVGHTDVLGGRMPPFL